MTLGVLALGYASLYWKDVATIERALAETRADGVPLTLHEIRAFYPTNPETEEATRLWQAAIAELKNVESDGKREDQLWLVESDEPLSGEDVAQAREFLDARGEAFDATQAASENSAAARYPVAFERHYAAPIPHAQFLRNLANLLRVDMKVRLAEGDAEGALKDILAVVAAAESLRNEPLLVTQYVRLSLLGVAVGMTEEAFAETDFDDAQLRRLDETFAAIDLFSGYQKAFCGERFMFVEAFHTQADTLSGEKVWWRGLHGDDLAMGLKLFRLIDGVGESDLHETVQRCVAAAEEFAPLEEETGSRYVLTTLLFPNVTGARRAFFQGEAEIALAQVAIACERYRLEQGVWPSRLADLAPKFLPAVPLDPFRKQPLTYVVDGSDLLVYSFGIDQLDDGGLDDPGSGDLPFRLIGGGKKNAEEGAKTP